MSGRLLGVALVAGAALLALFALVSRRPGTLPCLDGARRVEVEAPSGRQAWCERAAPDAMPVRHGPYTAWYPDGRPKIEGGYRDGLPAGRWVFRYPDGRKREEGEFRDGRPEGRWMRWWGSGQPLEGGDYRAGVRQGRWTFWFANGMREREGDYEGGAPAGPWRRWNLRGDPCPLPAGSWVSLAYTNDATRLGVKGRGMRP